MWRQYLSLLSIPHASCASDADRTHSRGWWVEEKPGWVKGQCGSTCDSEEGWGGDYDQDGETEARLGGMVRVRSRDEH